MASHVEPLLSSEEWVQMGKAMPPGVPYLFVRLTAPNVCGGLPSSTGRDCVHFASSPSAAAVARFWQWLIDDEIEIVSFDEVQVRAAAVAFDRYRKGIEPKARLNVAIARPKRPLGR